MTLSTQIILVASVLSLVLLTVFLRKTKIPQVALDISAFLLWVLSLVFVFVSDQMPRLLQSILCTAGLLLLMLSVFFGIRESKRQRNTKPPRGLPASRRFILRWFEYYVYLFDEDADGPFVASGCAGLLMAAFKKKLPNIAEETEKDAEQEAVRHIYRLSFAELAAGDLPDGVGSAPALRRTAEKSAAWLKERGLLSAEQADNDSALLSELRRGT